MKSPYYCDATETLEEKVLRLRYGTRTPSREAGALFSMAVVAKYLQVSYRHVASIVSRYFYRKYQAKPRNTKLTKAQEEVVTSRSFLAAHVTWTLAERAKYLNRTTRGARANPSTIRRLYAARGIKKKKLVQRRATAPELTEAKRQALAEELLEVDAAEDCDIFQIDECAFLGKDHVKAAWSARGSNLTLEVQQPVQSKAVKVIGAIASNGKYYYHVSDQYPKAADVKRFLKFINRRQRGRPWAVFWDNARTHTAEVVRDYLERFDIPCVFNVPYEPQLNGIETLWAHQKREYRRLLTDAKTGSERFVAREIVERLQRWSQRESRMVSKAANEGWRNVFAVKKVC